MDKEDSTDDLCLVVSPSDERAGSEILPDIEPASVGVIARLPRFSNSIRTRISKARTNTRGFECPLFLDET